MKGLRPLDEMARLPIDVRVDGVHRLEVPGVTGERHLVVMSSRSSWTLRGKSIWQRIWQGIWQKSWQ
jgi:hypothetical protein